MTALTGTQIADQAPPGWAYLCGTLATRFHTPDFATGLTLLNAIGAAAEEADHHPDLDLRYHRLDVRTWSHDVDAVTARDIRLAHRSTALAAELGLSPDATGPACFELALDTPDRGRIQPFWRAVLGYVDRPGAGDEVRDPAGAQPAIWFQDSGAEADRQRWHPDVWVDPADVAARIDAALAAGGALVSAADAPAFWVLADPEGNRMCLCTWQARDGG